MRQRRDGYAACGRATRQARRRLRDGDYTFADWKIADWLLDRTTAYSRLADSFFHDEIDLGLSERQIRQSLAKLGREVFSYRPGRGRGVRSYVAVPPEGEGPSCKAPKSGTPGLPLSPAEKRQILETKSGTGENEKRHSTRTRTCARPSFPTEKNTEKDRGEVLSSAERDERIIDAVCRATNSTTSDPRLRPAAEEIGTQIRHLTDEAAAVEIERRANNLRRSYSDSSWVTPKALARDWHRADADGRGPNGSDFDEIFSRLDDPAVRARL
jgi:hypothetical protein